MTTDLVGVSQHLNAIAKLLYIVPDNKTAIALNTVVANTSTGTVKVNLFKQDATGENYNLIPPRTDVYTTDSYRPPIEKLVLNTGEKVYASAGSGTPAARATGLFGLPVMLDPVDSEDVADVSLSVAQRDI